MAKPIFCTGVLLLGLVFRAMAGPEFLLGADAGYTLDQEKQHKTWFSENHLPSPLSHLLAQAGFNTLRLRIWTGDDGPNGLNEASELARRAQAAGLQIVPVLFLSEDWADYMKQPLPAIWKGLTFDARVQAIQAYAARVARHLEKQGLHPALYEIGNEIDFGLCGEFEEDWAKRLNPPCMKQTIWPRQARLIRAAEEGIRQVNPSAKFILHLTQWWNSPFCAAFFQTMLDSGVAVDFAGLSFYPTSGLSPKNSLEAFRASTSQLAAAIHRPLLICEFAYPSEPRFPGQFSTWNHPIAGYSLSEDGQARWIAAFLQCARDTGFIQGVFYWSPEWYASGMWSAFALFDGQGKPKKALREFSTASEKQR